MKDLPKISIITPSYNQEAFLERTILSVINQAYPNIEYIIMDGGSTDGSIDIIKKYSSSLYYWETAKDKGQSNAINKGLKIATGDIVTWLNSDDFYLDGTLKKVAAIWQKKPFDFLAGNAYFVDEQDQLLTDQSKSQLINGNTFLPFRRDCVIHQPASFFSLKLYHQIGPLDETLHYSMDVDFWLKITARNIYFDYSDEYFTYFRRHSSAKSSGGNIQFIEDTMNSLFFKNELKKLNPPLYKIVKKTGIDIYLYNLSLEHYTMALFKSAMRYFPSAPLIVSKRIITYINNKTGLFLKNKLSAFK